MELAKGLPPLSDELSSMSAADRRHVGRVKKILDSANIRAGESLPNQADGDESALEGTYRALNNERIVPEWVLDAHQRRTADRASEHPVIIVPHDTTSFVFGGEAKREGLGPVCEAKQGMYAHFSLALAPSGQPLGVIGLRVWRRSNEPKPPKGSSKLGVYREDRESLRWHDAVHEVIERLEGKAKAVHVMDREGDSYELFADLLEHDQRFVIRVCHDRVLGDYAPSRRVHDRPRLYEAMAAADTLLEREVPIGRRGKPRNAPARRLHPARDGRMARLSVRATEIKVPRSESPVHLPDFLTLNFVEVIELEPPEGQDPVHWRLVTSYPVDTAEHVAAIIDCYRMRWRIEEYFKAIKTGCRFENLQLASGRALVSALVVYCIVAWRLLLVRWMEREQPEAAASIVVTPVQLKLLANHQRKIRRPWPDRPTCRDVLLAIAALGGHIRNNGQPGWIVLGRGFDKLLLMELGVYLADRGAAGLARSPPEKRSDQ
jgi:hypothetical protein